MKNRLEYKYLVPTARIDQLRRDILVYLRPDEYAMGRPKWEYTVRSIYLDTHDYRSYREKADGLRSRQKFRIRGYNTWFQNAPVFLEIKSKQDSFISKSRARTPFANLRLSLDNSWIIGDGEQNDRLAAESFFYHYHLRLLEPKVLIVYDREAFECKFGSQLRITFDKNIRSKLMPDPLRLYEDDELMPLFRREFVLEVKFFQVLPQWIQRVLERYDLTRTAVSKYVLSIDRLSPSAVRSNRFTRHIDHTGSANECTICRA
jgi:hypothetical protein